MKKFLYGFLLPHIIATFVILFPFSIPDVPGTSPDWPDATVAVAADQLDILSEIRPAWKPYFTVSPSYTFQGMTTGSTQGVVFISTVITLPQDSAASPFTAHRLRTTTATSSFSTMLTLQPHLKRGRLMWNLRAITVDGQLPTKHQALYLRKLAYFGLVSAWDRIIRNSYIATLHGYRLKGVEISEDGLTIRGYSRQLTHAETATD